MYILHSLSAILDRYHVIRRYPLLIIGVGLMILTPFFHPLTWGTNLGNSLGWMQLILIFAGLGLSMIAVTLLFLDRQRKNYSKPIKKPNLKGLIVGESIFLILTILAYIKFGSPYLLYLYIAGLLYTVPAYIARKRKYDQFTQKPSNIS